MSLADYIEDEGAVYDEIINHMLEGYASGARVAAIYTANWLAYGSLTKWNAGWIRKAGIGGIWKDSKGIYNKFSSRPNQHSPKIDIGQAIQYQSKIQIILALIRGI